MSETEGNCQGDLHDVSYYVSQVIGFFLMALIDMETYYYVSQCFF